MLAPVHELEFDEPELLAAGLRSRDIYFSDLAELAQKADLIRSGIWEIALRREDTPLLTRDFEFQKSFGLEVEWHEGRDLVRSGRIPGLSPHVGGAIFAPSDGQLDPRRWPGVLASKLKEAGIRILENTPLTSLGEGPKNGLWQTEAGNLVFFGRELILTTGISSHPVTGLNPDAWPEQVFPVRGQMVAVAPPPPAFSAEPFLQPVRLRSKAFGNAYIVPKKDRWILGSTSEEMGFDPSLTAGGLLDILRKTYAAMPVIYELPVLETWTAFRPATLRRQPFVCRNAAGIWFVNGLYRHGILLSPLIGRTAAALLTGGSVPAEALPFV
jgi:glycine oxidase